MQPALVEIHDATNVYVGNSTFEALGSDIKGPFAKFTDGLDVAGILIDLFSTDDWRTFEDKVRGVAVDLAGHDQGTREHFWREILMRVEPNRLRSLSMGEENAYRRFAYALLPDPPDPLALVDQLIAIREEIIRAQPAVALEIGWAIADALNPGIDGVEVRTLRNPGRTRAAEVVIENNVVIGNISFYGQPDDDWLMPNFKPRLDRLDQLLPNNGEEGIILIDGLLGVAHLRGNHLARVLVSRAMTDALRQLSQQGGGGLLETLFKSFHCADNVFDGNPSIVVAEHISLTSNNFTLDAVRDLVGPGQAPKPATLPPNVAVGDSGVYVGNHGRHTIATINSSTITATQTSLRDVTRASAAGDTNLELTMA